LESFARFGTHLDDSTRHTIEHGRRIRECLKQAESHPVPLTEQITVLIALIGGLFDRIALKKVADAENTLRLAAAGIPAEILARFTSADKLTDADRKATLEVAAKALAPFQPPPATKSVPAVAA
jgi:F-type H+/Na+-transporting ATPase subunit alpha